MKKFIWVIFGIVFILGTVLISNAEDESHYICKHYMKGKENSCIIKIQNSKLYSPNCPYLTSQQMSTLISGKSCKYNNIIADTTENYFCNYPTGKCTITVTGGKKYSITCTKGLDNDKAYRDFRLNKCIKEKTANDEYSPQTQQSKYGTLRDFIEP